MILEVTLLVIDMNLIKIRYGNGVGWGGVGPKDGSLPPLRIVLSYPIPALLCMMGEIFLPHPHPLGPCEVPLYPVKLYFLLIFPQLVKIF